MRPIVTIFVPEGYKSADEFLKDCKFEGASLRDYPDGDIAGEFHYRASLVRPDAHDRKGPA